LEEQIAKAQTFARESSTLFKNDRIELERILALPKEEAKAAPIVSLSADLFMLLASLRATVVAENGVGIAAPQIGVGQRVILVKRLDRPQQNGFVAVALKGSAMQPGQASLYTAACNRTAAL
jgi:hypothetical protein